MLLHGWHLFWRAFLSAPALLSGNWAAVAFAVLLFAIGVVRRWKKERPPMLIAWIRKEYGQIIKDGFRVGVYRLRHSGRTECGQDTV